MLNVINSIAVGVLVFMISDTFPYPMFLNRLRRNIWEKV